MPDIIDRANDLAQTILTHALQRQRARTAASGPSAADCESCGEPIPDIRRQAVPGCTRCVDCQQHAEREGRA